MIHIDEEMLENIIYALFNCEISMDDPTQTINEIKRYVKKNS